MIMTTGCASTKSNRGSSDQHILLLPLYSVPAGNTSRNRARGRLFLRSLVVLVRESAEADGAGAGRGELAGYRGEGLRVGVFPVGDLAVGQFGRSPVGRHGRKGRVGFCCVGVLLCLAGTVRKAIRRLR